jgi:TfoX/Sxy family transcriptional regulator of competence genes
MSYDEELAQRTRAILASRDDVIEKKMFGGLAFMVRGHMCVGIVDRELMVRIGPDAYETALADSHARPMDFTGKPLRGMVYVQAAGLRTAAGLRSWVDRGLRFVSALAPKSAAAPKRQSSKSAAPKRRATKR